MPKETAKQIKERFPAYCTERGLPEPTPEFKFHATRRWKIDYYWDIGGTKLALECEGGVWQQGRHTRGSGFVKDMEKYNEISLHGIWLLRATPQSLCSEQTITMVKQKLQL